MRQDNTTRYTRLSRLKTTIKYIYIYISHSIVILGLALVHCPKPKAHNAQMTNLKVETRPNHKGPQRQSFLSSIQFLYSFNLSLAPPASVLLHTFHTFLISHKVVKACTSALLHYSAFSILSILCFSPPTGHTA